MECDVTDEATIDAAVDLARRTQRARCTRSCTTPRATGRASRTGSRTSTLALWDEHAAVSLRGAYHCARAGFEALRETQGTLILMTSPAGMEGSLGLAALRHREGRAARLHQEPGQRVGAATACR